MYFRSSYGLAACRSANLRLQVWVITNYADLAQNKVYNHLWTRWWLNQTQGFTQWQFFPIDLVAPTSPADGPDFGGSIHHVWAAQLGLGQDRPDGRMMLWANSHRFDPTGGNVFSSTKVANVTNAPWGQWTSFKAPGPIISQYDDIGIVSGNISDGRLQLWLYLKNYHQDPRDDTPKEAVMIYSKVQTGVWYNSPWSDWAVFPDVPGRTPPIPNVPLLEQGGDLSLTAALLGDGTLRLWAHSPRQVPPQGQNAAHVLWSISRSALSSGSDYHNPNAGWGSWQVFQSQNTKGAPEGDMIGIDRVVSATDGNGVTYLWIQIQHASFPWYYTWTTSARGSPAQFGPWQPFPMPPGAPLQSHNPLSWNFVGYDFAVAKRETGQLQIFITNRENIWTKMQTSSSPTAWSNWANFDLPPIPPP